MFPAFVRLGLATGLIAAASVVAAAPAMGATAHEAAKPPARTVTKDGATGRYLLSGTWLFRRDPANRGIKAGFYRQRSAGGWSPVTVPNAWNAGDYSNASQGGGVAWYRKDFKLPQNGHGLTWLVRFESVRYRASVWLNGRRVGFHAGAYLPWELRLRGLRGGNNRLVVRVDNRQHTRDLPPGRTTITGQPSGGWWNWGGLLGDVYLRRVNRIDMPQVQVLPEVPCRTCDATILYRVMVHNYGRRARVRVSSSFGGTPVSLGSKAVGAGRSKLFTGSVKIPHPHLWWPSDPHLYPVTIQARGGGRAGWFVESGVRQFTVQNGRLMLNGRGVNFRGGFFHQESPAKGGASDPARFAMIIDRIKRLGGSMLRTHYPTDPLLNEMADHQGVLIWSEIPAYQVSGTALGLSDVRRKAFSMLRDNVIANGNHPSVFVWSVGNELNPTPTFVEAGYYKKQAAIAHSLDPTRPVGLAIQGYPLAGCQAAYAPIQLLGVNDYFGWYPGPEGSVADRTQLSAFLDQMRGCYQQQALAITEFGAEANRDGPAEERGTYQFQSDINEYHLNVFASKPWLSGATGMLLEFHVRPEWSGGNPYPSSPMHQKAVFDFNGNPKPAADVLSRWYHQTQQYDLP